MTREHAIEIARAHALVNNTDHSYLPANATDAETWQPHEWVIRAIQFAAAQPDPTP